MSAHAKYSASQAYRWLHCPGSVALIDELERIGKIPLDIPSSAAKEGTAAHYLLEINLLAMLLGRRDISAQDDIGREIFVDRIGNAFFCRAPGQETHTVDSEMADGVDLALNHVRKVLTSMGARTKTPDDVEIDVEASIDVKHLPHAEMLGGTADVRICQYFGDLHVIDFKYGRSKVYPKENPQLKIYALGSDIMKHMHPMQVHLTIIQPRTPNPIRTWTTTPKDLRNWVDAQLNPVLTKALTAHDLVLNSGVSQCRWCRAKPCCPQIATQSLQQAQDEFDVVEE